MRKPNCFLSWYMDEKEKVTNKVTLSPVLYLFIYYYLSAAGEEGDSPATYFFFRYVRKFKEHHLVLKLRHRSSSNT